MADDVNRVSGKKNKTSNLILLNFKILKLKNSLISVFDLENNFLDNYLIIQDISARQTTEFQSVLFSRFNTIIISKGKIYNLR